MKKHKTDAIVSRVWKSAHAAAANHMPFAGNAFRLWPLCYLEPTPLKHSFLLRENPLITDVPTSKVTKWQ